MDLHFHQEVNIPVGKVILTGEVSIPVKAKAIIVFSHGSGSSRFSKRNQMVAEYLHEKNFGTLLFDLLTEEEDKKYYNRFDIDLLTKRLAGATEWLERFPAAKDCRIGYFGASTGAASALKAAAILSQVSAVVSRGGRPDLVMDELHNVDAPTLLIVGSLDYDVMQLNKEAYIQLECEKKFEVIEGASHLFEEPGMMEKVCEKAASWFEKYLYPVSAIK
jgi:dienelactone hydrolase